MAASLDFRRSYIVILEAKQAMCLAASQRMMLALVLCIGLAATTPAQAQADRSIEKSVEKAIAYLAAETPKWRAEQHCASCHHQGGAVRGLLAARAKGLLKDDRPLENSLEWLTHPAKWPDNHGDPNASDQALADLQFGASLLAAEKQFPDRFRDSLTELGRQLAKKQTKDGSMQLEVSDGLATPITLGPILLTAIARDAFQKQGKELAEREFAERAKRANDWLVSVKPRNTFEASSLLIALKERDAEKSIRTAARKIVLASAHGGGGFGPYVNSPAEAFDTALAILALSRDEEAQKHHPIIEKAKKQLVAWQRDDGSWEETELDPARETGLYFNWTPWPESGQRALPRSSRQPRRYAAGRSSV